MTGTKIKGHRIEDHAIKKKHFDSSEKFNESELELNHPTHSNEADLTLEQKNTLTMQGNADSLHFHNGGGGGANGIYTNEERDAQILRMSMMINAAGTGLDKSVRDNLDSDENIEYNMSSAKSPTLVANGEGGSMNGGVAYTYGVSYKNKYGKTNVTSTKSVLTPSGVSGSIGVTLEDVPSENTGVEIYRSNGFASDVIQDFNDASRETICDSSPFLVTKGKNGKNSIVSEKREWNSSYPDKDILNYMDTGYVDTTLMKKSTMINVESNTTVTHIITAKDIKLKPTNRVAIKWGAIWGIAPEDYELYYSNQSIPTHNEEYAMNHISWKPLTGLYVGRNQLGGVVGESTDGVIEGNKITKNNNNYNNFFLETETNIAALKIVVKNAPREYMLDKVFMYEKGFTGYGTLICELEKFSSDDYNVVWCDIKSDDTAGPALHFMSDRLEPKAENGVVNVGSVPQVSSSPNVTMSNANSLSDTSNAIGFYRHSFKYMMGAINNEYDLRYAAVRYGIQGNYYPSDTNAQTKYEHLTFNGLPSSYGNSSNYDIDSDYIVLGGGYRYTSSRSIRALSVIDRGQACMINNYTAYYSNGSKSAFTTTFTDVVTNTNNGLLYRKHVYSDFGDFGMNRYIRVPGKTTRVPVYIPKKESLTFSKLAIGYGTSEFELGNITASSSKVISGQVVGDIANIAYVNKERLDYASTFNMTPKADTPQVMTFEFDKAQDIDAVDIHILNNKECVLQYTENINADNDDLLSNDWKDVSNLKFTFEDLLHEYEGSYEIAGGRIRGLIGGYGHVVHMFDKVRAFKLRVIVYNSSTSIYNFQPLLISNNSELKLLHSVDKKINQGYQFLDDGKSTANIKPSEFNTTGSYNVTYNKGLKLIELSDKGKQGIVYFKEINLPMFQNIMISSQKVGDVDFEVSIDGGLNFESVIEEDVFVLNKQSESLIVKAILNSSDAKLSAIGILYSL